jgi:hypothetical protein
VVIVVVAAMSANKERNERYYGRKEEYQRRKEGRKEGRRKGRNRFLFIDFFKIGVVYPLELPRKGRGR